MTRSKRLKPAVEVAQSREREAARLFAAQQRIVEQEKKRLADLEAFRTEYRQGYAEQAGIGMSAARLRQWQLFLGNLDQAIAHQRQALAVAERHCEQKRQAWLLSRRRRKAVDKVVERCRSEEQMAEAKQDQKLLDEIGQRKGRPSE